MSVDQMLNQMGAPPKQESQQEKPKPLRPHIREVSTINTLMAMEELEAPSYN